VTSVSANSLKTWVGNETSADGGARNMRRSKTRVTARDRELDTAFTRTANHAIRDAEVSGRPAGRVVDPHRLADRRRACIASQVRYLDAKDVGGLTPTGLTGIKGRTPLDGCYRGEVAGFGGGACTVPRSGGSFWAAASSRSAAGRGAARGHRLEGDSAFLRQHRKSVLVAR